MANPKTFKSDYERGREAAIEDCLSLLRAHAQNSIAYVLPLVRELKQPGVKHNCPGCDQPIAM